MIEGSTQTTAPERFLLRVMEGMGWGSLFACGSIVAMGGCIALMNVRNWGKKHER